MRCVEALYRTYHWCVRHVLHSELGVWVHCNVLLIVIWFQSRGSVVKVHVVWSVAIKGSGLRPTPGNYFLSLFQLFSELKSLVQCSNTSAVFVICATAWHIPSCCTEKRTSGSAEELTDSIAIYEPSFQIGLHIKLIGWRWPWHGTALSTPDTPLHSMLARPTAQ